MMKMADMGKRLAAMEAEIKMMREMMKGEEPVYEAEVDADEAMEQEDEEQEDGEDKAPKKAAAIAMLKKKIGA